MVLISAIVCVYYNVIIAWTLYYFVRSFSWVLPWSHCENEWNTEACSLRVANSTNQTSWDDPRDATTALGRQPRTPSEEFWE